MLFYRNSPFFLLGSSVPHSIISPVSHPLCCSSIIYCWSDARVCACVRGLCNKLCFVGPIFCGPLRAVSSLIALFILHDAKRCAQECTYLTEKKWKLSHWWFGNTVYNNNNIYCGDSHRDRWMIKPNISYFGLRDCRLSHCLFRNFRYLFKSLWIRVASPAVPKFDIENEKTRNKMPAFYLFVLAPILSFYSFVGCPLNCFCGFSRCSSAFV